MCEGSFNLEERVLCMDGGCIGLVGPDGKCKVCGLVYEGELPKIEKNAEPSNLAMHVQESDAAESDVGSPRDAETVDSQDERICSSEQRTGSLDQRICCADDNCIGIVGSDGRCGTCGMLFEK